MSYTVRTCCECGLRAPQPEMFQRKRHIEVAKSQDSFSGATLLGWMAGNKDSEKKIVKTLLNNGERTYKRNVTSWYCKEHVDHYDKQQKTRERVVTGIGAVVALPFLLAFLHSGNNSDAGKSTTEVMGGAPLLVVEKSGPRTAGLSESDEAKRSSEPFEDEPLTVTEAENLSHEVSPSFDCHLASLPAERAICDTPALAALDIALSDSYRRLGNVLPHEMLVKFGRNLHSARMSCGADLNCLERTSKDSIRMFESLQALDEGSLERAFLDLDTASRLLVQRKMNELGSYSAAIDGLWGPGTRDALLQTAIMNISAGEFQENASSKALLNGLLVP